MDPVALDITAVALLSVASLAGAGVAGFKMRDPQLPTGRAVALSVMAFLLLLVGIACAAFAWWFWRFTVEFTY
jgi:hypothetical protein